MKFSDLYLKTESWCFVNGLKYDSYNLSNISIRPFLKQTL